MTNDELAKVLARRLMALGDESTPAHRMQYMCGTYPHGEIPSGGMCEEALEHFFAKELDDLMPSNAAVKGGV